jgi:hypothetical protein
MEKNTLPTGGLAFRRWLGNRGATSPTRPFELSSNALPATELRTEPGFSEPASHRTVVAAPGKGPGEK